MPFSSRYGPCTSELNSRMLWRVPVGRPEVIRTEPTEAHALTRPRSSKARIELSPFSSAKIVPPGTEGLARPRGGFLVEDGECASRPDTCALGDILFGRWFPKGPRPFAHVQMARRCRMGTARRRRTMYGKTLTISALVAGFVVMGCAPDDQEYRPPDDQPTAEAPEVPRAEEMSRQLDAFRSEVQAAMGDLRSDIQRMEENLVEDQQERWEQLSSRVEQMEETVQRDLERLEAADAQEARAVRDDASEVLAELEAEVARADMELATDSEELSSRAEEKLARLELDLDDIARAVREYRETLPADPDAEEQEHDLRALEGLRTELDELRTNIARVPEVAEDDPEFADVRDELSERLATLTREVRELWYGARWSDDVTG